MNKVICFHNPDEENGWLSNWYHSEFFINGFLFSTLEQYMMFEKARLFGDQVSMDKVLSSTDPAHNKEVGRSVQNYNETVWNGIRQIIVYEGLLEKFTQNGDLGRKLIQTGDAILAECAVKDKIWGIGLSMDDPNRFDLNAWQGQNLLGFTLMMVRDTIRANDINTLWLQSLK